MLFHQRSCNSVTTSVFPGGGYGQKKNFFDLMIEYGIEVRDSDKSFPYRIAFNFEYLNLNLNELK